MQYRIRIEGLEELRRRASDPALVAQPIGRFIARSAFEIEAQAKQIAPVGKSRPGYTGGRYRASIHAEVTPTHAIIGPNTNYAPILEFGSSPHIIRPRNRKALRWFAGGQPVFARLVHHPGTRAQYIMRRAAENALGTIQEYADMLADEIRQAWSR